MKPVMSSNINPQASSVLNMVVSRPIHKDPSDSQTAIVSTEPSMMNDNRIVGGYPIFITEAPYQVSLMRRMFHICGGEFNILKHLQSF